MNAIIWGAMLFPFALIAFFIINFNKQTKWYFVVAPVVVTPLIIYGAYYIAFSSFTGDIEYWTGWVEKAVWEEHWTERVETTSKDKNGNVTTHVSYVYHPDNWYVVDNNNVTVTINQSEFEELCINFGERKQVTTWHVDQSSIGDGREFVTHYHGPENRLRFVTSTHRYENRVALTNSIKSYPEIKDKTNLFDYPTGDSLHTPSVLGLNDHVANHRLTYWNAKLGHFYQIRIWLLVFHDLPMQYALDQESYWKGGNKNEYVLCVGIDKDKNIQWVHNFSWTEEENLMSQTKQNVLLNYKDFKKPEKVIDDLVVDIQKMWKRKHFKDYNYISIELPWYWILFVYGSSLLSNLGFGFYLVREFNKRGNRYEY